MFTLDDLVPEQHQITLRASVFYRQFWQPGLSDHDGDGARGRRQVGPNDMHYPHKLSKRKRVRKIGFRARMRTKKGRQMISRKRRAGRAVQVV